MFCLVSKVLCSAFLFAIPVIRKDSQDGTDGMFYGSFMSQLASLPVFRLSCDYGFC